MKIAQICPYDIDRPGGVQTHIRDLSEELVRLGHDVTIIAPRVGAYPPSPVKDAAIVRIGKGRKIG